jgi:predicted negative regulator of RcsB-dependent stress response
VKEETPQPRDPVKVAQAVADAGELVQSLGTEEGRASRYAEKLGDLMTARLDDAVDLNDLRDRLAYVLYGLTVYGAAATALDSPASESFEATVARVAGGVDSWLKANS